MPIHDLGYRGWNGQLESPLFRWWIVALTGIRLAWKNAWLRRLLLAAWLPAVYLSIGIFMFERAMEDPREFRESVSFIRLIPEAEEAENILTFLSASNISLLDDESKLRHDIWALILHTLFRYPQGFLMVLVVGIIAPPLIARDFRSRAFLIYFSRPLTRFEYLFGKAATVWVYLSLITTLPALALYVLGVLLSPDVSVLFYTWDLPFRILAASAVLMIPTTAIALFLSAVTQQARNAGFAWFTIWIFGWVVYSSVFASATIDISNRRRVEVRDQAEIYFHDKSAAMNSRQGEIQIREAERRLRREPAFDTTNRLNPMWSLVSMYHLLGNVQTWIFGLEQDPTVAAASILLLGLITFLCFGSLLRLISAPMRV